MNNVFNNNKLFYDIVSNEFSVFLQLNSLVPEFLCQYIDEKLRKEKFTVNIILHTFLYFNIYLLTLMVIYYLMRNSNQFNYSSVNKAVVLLFQSFLYCFPACLMISSVNSFLGFLFSLMPGCINDL